MTFIWFSIHSILLLLLFLVSIFFFCIRCPLFLSLTVSSRPRVISFLSLHFSSCIHPSLIDPITIVLPSSSGQICSILICWYNQTTDWWKDDAYIEPEDRAKMFSCDTHCLNKGKEPFFAIFVFPCCRKILILVCFLFMMWILWKLGLSHTVGNSEWFLIYEAIKHHKYFIIVRADMIYTA